MSRFSVSNSMLLNVIARPGNCFDAMRHLLEDNHEPRPAQRKHILKAISLYRGLLSAGIVQQLDEPDEYGRMARLTVDLAARLRAEPAAVAVRTGRVRTARRRCSDGYALDVVSIIESTLDDPRQVLMAQQHAARGEAVAQMKADGIEYDERMELLEEVTWPKPLAELLIPAFEIYRGGHPWISEFAVVPEIGGARHDRARYDLRRIDQPLRARAIGRARAAVPRRRLPRPAPDGAGPRRAPRNSRTSSSGSVSSSGRSIRACSTNGNR